ncbi:MAG: hypothetical protein IT292_05335 [Deltaproteobacteria bacterium]|nr:hypothetical protein [Deltaproteobacteria bacterium]
MTTLLYSTNDKTEIISALILSLVVHLVFFTTAASYKIIESKKSSPIKIEVKTIEKKQLVLPPTNISEQVTKDTKLASTHNAVTASEQLSKKQADKQPSPFPPTQAQVAKGTDSKQVKQAPSLFLDPATLQTSLSNSSRSEELKTSAQDKYNASAKTIPTAKIYKLVPFAKAPKADLFAGGTPAIDYLPDIPDGDITLLNTKAEQHAVFVQRVALQVFAAIRRENWQKIPALEIHKLSDFTTIEAVMNKKGTMVALNFIGSSGSKSFDQMTLAAINKSFTDQNPPAEACSDDGNIHFLFKSRSWSRLLGGGIGEQRWLLLGTALE